MEVTNDTLDYYRYYNATKQVEFLFDCVNDTIENVIPKEVAYLKKFDAFKRFLEDEYEMPDKMIAILLRILEQNEGELSQRARKKEFDQLTDQEIQGIEKRFEEIFF